MSQGTPPTPLSTDDFAAIESALTSSARGRWFLAEYARRNRTADTQVLLDALGRLEASVQPPHATATDLIYRDLLEMREAISRVRGDVAALKATDGDSQLANATKELDAVVKLTEKATCDILTAVEAVQDTALRLRENPADPEISDHLIQQTIDIYSACSFQDLVGQRVAQVVQALRFVEARLNSMIDIWGLDDLEVEAAGDGPARAADATAGPGEDKMRGLIASFEDIEIVDVSERDAARAASGDDWFGDGGTADPDGPTSSRF